ncbi:hypothetical protein [Rhizorhabdus phycosphaerae]|uniref:hypothetical protein n=1 Tax=Rhizorhabdus phycosphaerae TaxID=2711156 RepID=UPI0013ECC3DC|nr:hypothetical protein [Rhizorhabdus phycosphaerae]
MSSGRHIVYFGYLGDEASEDAIVAERLAYMDGQMRWLEQLVARLADGARVLVPYVAPRKWDEAVHARIAAHGFAVDPLSVEADRHNRFEYPGFRALKALAETLPPDEPIFYCHSKGIGDLSQTKNGLFRLHSHVALAADLDAFLRDPALTRAGLFPSRYGWCWYNLFWIKAGHMARLTVEEREDRYAFEELIGDRSETQAFRGVLPLIDRLPAEVTAIEPTRWYRPPETVSPALLALYRDYAAIDAPPASL